MQLDSYKESHPAWVCGLKLLYIKHQEKGFQSHPAWVCGLKPEEHVFIFCFGVTPCVGVWIETWQNTQNMKLYSVTPCVGVWIETNSPLPVPYGVIESHPAWVCGLKPAFRQILRILLLSHPAWVCGLKLSNSRNEVANVRHTLRGCVD